MRPLLQAALESGYEYKGTMMTGMEAVSRCIIDAAIYEKNPALKRAAWNIIADRFDPVVNLTLHETHRTETIQHETASTVRDNLLERAKELGGGNVQAGMGAALEEINVAPVEAVPVVEVKEVDGGE